MANVILKTVPYVAMSVATAGLKVLPRNFGTSSQDQTERTAGQNTKKMKSVIYTNKKFGFRFSLPQSWTGYSIKISEWQGGRQRRTSIRQGRPAAAERSTHIDWASALDRD
jgi:hypothetical protein